jgi:YegS/Rv2252/BmrU family lipid kinase
MRIAVIINPVAGRGKTRRAAGTERAQLASRLIRRTGVDGEVVLTRAPGHAIALARQFADQRFDVVAAWGGDGTVNEVAGPLLATATTLAIVPGGSGDGLAHGLGIPDDPERALTQALGGLESVVDVGFLGDRHFLNIAGVGFDAAVGERFNRSGRHGSLSYGLHALSLVWSYRCPAYRLRVGSRELAGPRFLVAFANGREYGNGLLIAPDARLDDGLVNAVVVAGGSPVRQCWRARRLFWRRLAPAEGILRATVSSAQITGERLQCHVDGETFEASGTLDVRVEPGALRVARP